MDFNLLLRLDIAPQVSAKDVSLALVLLLDVHDCWLWRLQHKKRHSLRATRLTEMHHRRSLRRPPHLTHTVFDPLALIVTFGKYSKTRLANTHLVAFGLARRACAVLESGAVTTKMREIENVVACCDFSCFHQQHE